MKGIELGISEAQWDLLPNLMEQHRRLRTEANKMHNPLILQVPPEVASIIFKFCAPHVPFNPEDRSENWAIDVKAPLVLGAVCRGWRDIAWSIPQLWTRSCQLPLSVHVYIDEDAPALSLYEKQIIDILNQHAERWETLELSIPGPLMNMFKCNTESTRLSIRNLRLDSGSPYHCSPDPRGEFALGNLLPEPTNVYLRNRLLNSVSISWSCVTFIDVECLSVGECVQLLHEAITLERCQFYSIYRSTNQPVESAVTHPRLQDMKLIVVNSDTGKQLLDHITLPALQKLEINTNLEELPTAELFAMFRRSSCRLKEFAVVSSDFLDDEMCGLLRELPHLERLVLSPISRDKFSMSNFLTILSNTNMPHESQDPATYFLPHLRFLQIQMPWEIEWNLIAPIFYPLEELGHPRRRPLNCARFVMPSPPGSVVEKEILLGFLAILEAGLELEIFCLDVDDDFELIQASIEFYGLGDDGDSDEMDLE
ncbi:hypothetical protein CPB84DRAFT_1851820 [Gymnopilus junonius]|uniref:F-box domain-containing protein n=1 Tax=Gymnopilus junonius TaxID=109634 RepID=A0A9P5ND57_GYMJU|nr:hypothetical protein CPB84DRAFT_1851820 [Gymnopilus junonius]